MFAIDVRSSNVPISLALRDHIARKVTFALRRFAHRIDRVVVRLVDRRCRLSARLSGAAGAVVVSSDDGADDDVYSAVTRAAARLDETVSRKLARIAVLPSDRAFHAAARVLPVHRDRRRPLRLQRHHRRAHALPRQW